MTDFALTISAPFRDGDREIRVFRTPTPGVVIYERSSCDGPGRWCVMHQRSGTVLAYLNDPESAQAIAVELGPIADWTLPAEALRADDQVMAALRCAVSKCEPVLGQIAPVVDRNPL